MISADRLGKGIRTAPRDAMISLATPPAHLATAFGVHRALDTMGAVIGPMIAFALLRSVPGRFDAVFVASFSIAIVGFAVLLLLVDERPASLGEPAALPPIRATLSTLCSDARFVTITIAAALASFVVVSDAFLYLLLQWRAGMAIETIPLLYVGTATAYLALAAPFGRCADRMGRVPMFVAGHVCILAVYTAIAWFGFNATGLGLCLALHGAYYAATDGVLAALVSAATREGLRASSLSALATAMSAARLGGSLAVGLLWAWRGPQAVAVAGVIVLTMSIVCIAIALGRTPPDAVRTEAV